MPTTRTELLSWQFDLTWSLFAYHLELLEPDDFLAEPAPVCWTLRPADGGGWVPDWADTEPDPIPAPTIAWLTWHIGWWWTAAMDHVDGRRLPDRTEIHWPGSGAPTVNWMWELRTAWAAVLGRLTDADLDQPAGYPWPADAGLTVAHLAGWVNAELMKNAAEIGQLRIVRAAGR